MSTDLATIPQPKKRLLVEELADQAGLEPGKFYAAVKEACGCRGATDEHYAILLVQAKQLGLNPLSKHLWLIPAKSGVQVSLSIDGFMKLMLAHPQYLSHTVEVETRKDGTPVSATCTVWRKDQHAAGLPPQSVTEYFAECRTNGGPWRSHPMRMLRHRAIMQAARNSFGIFLPDEEEWQRAAEVESGKLPEKPTDALAALTASLDAEDTSSEPMTVTAEVTDAEPDEIDDGNPTESPFTDAPW